MCRFSWLARPPRSCRPEARTSCAGSPRFERFLGRSGNQPFAYRLLAGELAGTADRLALFPRRPLRRLLVEPAPLHFAEYAFALHLLLQDAERLIDIVVANEHLQILSPSVGRSRCRPRSLLRSESDVAPPAATQTEPR